MSQNPADSAGGLPRWLMLLLSAAIVIHLGAIGVRALAAPSGPWPMGPGSDMAGPPQFAYSLDSGVAWYLKGIRMTSDYRFPSDRPTLPGIYMEARLKDESGEELARVKIPDASANLWVRHRQRLLANCLGDDRPVVVPRSKLIPGPGQSVPEVEYWPFTQDNPNSSHLTRRSINDFDPNQRYERPSDLSLVLVRSFARQLCRTHGAARVEIIRHHQNPIPPYVLFMDDVQSAAFEEVTSNFGEFNREGKSIR